MRFRTNSVILVLVFCAVLVSFSDAQGFRCGNAPRRKNPPGWFKQFIEDLQAMFGRSLDRRIVNGNTAYRGQYPWQAELWWMGKTGVCGGTIIGRTWILTAAHCFFEETHRGSRVFHNFSQPEYWSDWSVTVGDHHLNDDTEHDDRHEVKAVYIHPSWKNELLYNTDLALMELKTPIDYDDFVQPACLPRPGAHPRSSHCYISGWGRLDNGAKKGSNVLMGAEVKIESKEDCAKYLKKTYFKYSGLEKQMCAGHKGTVDTCPGDSGGPLVCWDIDGYTVFGVTSFGHRSGCGSDQHPGVYVTVSKHLQFIHDVMGQ